MDIDKFRTDFPEFADAVCFPSPLITFWSTLGEKLISECRFGNVYVEAVQFFTAHNIVLASGNQKAVAAGGLPGSAGGVVNSKTVGSVSASYDSAATMLPNAGHWNQTIYGRQYLMLMRLMGQGCYQL